MNFTARFLMGIILAALSMFSAWASDVLQNVGQGPIISTRYYPDGQRIIVSDDTNRVLDVNTGEKLFNLSGPGLKNPHLTWNSLQIVGSVGGIAKMYDAQTGGLITTYDGRFGADIRDMIAYSSTTVIAVHQFRDPHMERAN